jgi:hypothetical protein
MSPACCGPKNFRIIKVGDSRAGVTGLDHLLEQASLEGWSPRDQRLGERLVEGLRAAGNFVAPTSETAYAEALLGLYHDYVGANQKEKPKALSVAPARK